MAVGSPPTRRHRFRFRGWGAAVRSGSDPIRLRMGADLSRGKRETGYATRAALPPASVVQGEGTAVPALYVSGAATVIILMTRGCLMPTRAGALAPSTLGTCA